MHKYKYILFDMDGTLVDTAEGIKNCVEYAISELQDKPLSSNQILKFVGPPLKESFINICGFSEEKATEAVRLFRERYSQIGIFECELYEGVEEMLSELKSLGFCLFVATSKPTDYSEKIATKLNIDYYFKGIVGSNLDNTRTKKAEIITYIMNKHNISENLLMVGDREHDLIGAELAGIDAVGVTYGYGTQEELMHCKNVGILHNPLELVTFLSKAGEK